MQIVVLQEAAMWTGAIEDQRTIEIPDNMCLETEEKNWFGAGGGTIDDFVNFLLSKGAKKRDDITIWTINYR